MVKHTNQQQIISWTEPEKSPNFNHALIWKLILLCIWMRFCMMWNLCLDFSPKLYSVHFLKLLFQTRFSRDCFRKHSSLFTEYKSSVSLCNVFFLFWGNQQKKFTLFLIAKLSLAASIGWVFFLTFFVPHRRHLTFDTSTLKITGD